MKSSVYLNGNILRKIRLTSGMTTVQMAKFAGVKTRKTYENWEKNVGQPNVNQFFAMTQACGISAIQAIEIISGADLKAVKTKGSA